MAKIVASVLRIASRTSRNVTLTVTYNLLFTATEVGQEYRARIYILPEDKGTNWIPKPIINGRSMPNLIVAREGLMQKSHSLTLPKGMLNEDKNSKDEIYARIELKAPYPALNTKTTVLISEFK